MDVAKEYDAIVVGSGPAGAMAARALAEKGLKTLIVERRKEIGVPVRCGEAIAENAYRMSGLPVEPPIIANVVDGAWFDTPQKEGITLDMPLRGFVLNRDVFEKELVQSAVETGAGVEKKTTVTGMKKSRDMWVVLTNRERYGARAVVGADGVESRVGRWAGIKTAIKVENTGVAAQYVVGGMRFGENAHRLGFAVDWDFTETGYAWTFPKGGGKANVGILLSGENGGRVWGSLDRYAALMKKKNRDMKILARVNGAIPLSPPARVVAANGVFLCGDAARLANAFSGGGIRNALLSGKMAGEGTVEYLSEPGGFDVEKYHDTWHRTFDRDLLRGIKMREEVLHHMRETGKIVLFVRMMDFAQKVLPENVTKTIVAVLLQRMSRSFIGP